MMYIRVTELIFDSEKQLRVGFDKYTVLEFPQYIESLPSKIEGDAKTKALLKMYDVRHSTSSHTARQC
jgi:hypothetical protein